MWNLLDEIIAASVAVKVLLVALFIAFTLFQIFMLADCVKRKFDSNAKKAFWGAFLLFLGPVAAPAYFFIVKIPELCFKKKK